jgi:predicted secreted protein
MALGSMVAIYFVIWWIGLFAVLPWGVRSQHEDGNVVPGTEPGAPVATRLLRIALVNTVFAGLVFGAFYLNWTQGWITLENVPFLPRYSLN